MWLELRRATLVQQGMARGSAGRRQRLDVLAEISRRLPFCYVPAFYEPEYQSGRFLGFSRTRQNVPETIEPAVITDLEGIPLPTRPIVPYVECVHDRIAIEIMRGCPWQCRSGARLRQEGETTGGFRQYGWVNGNGSRGIPSGC